MAPPSSAHLMCLIMVLLPYTHCAGWALTYEAYNPRIGLLRAVAVGFQIALCVLQRSLLPQMTAARACGRCSTCCSSSGASDARRCLNSHVISRHDPIPRVRDLSLCGILCA
jgi:hypothetical protein